MGPIWGRQDPGGPHVGPMNFAIWDEKAFRTCWLLTLCKGIYWWITLTKKQRSDVFLLLACISCWTNSGVDGDLDATTLMSRHCIVNTLITTQNDRQFADDKFTCIFSNRYIWISNKMSQCSAGVQLTASPNSKVHGAIMGPTWVLSTPDGPHEPCYQGVSQI